MLKIGLNYLYRQVGFILEDLSFEVPSNRTLVEGTLRVPSSGLGLICLSILFPRVAGK